MPPEPTSVVLLWPLKRHKSPGQFVLCSSLGRKGPHWLYLKNKSTWFVMNFASWHYPSLSLFITICRSLCFLRMFPSFSRGIPQVHQPKWLVPVHKLSGLLYHFRAPGLASVACCCCFISKSVWQSFTWCCSLGGIVSWPGSENPEKKPRSVKQVSLETLPCLLTRKVW